MPAPMTIAQAFSKSGGSLVIDLATGATRFAVSSEGVITDSKTGLEWTVGPHNTYSEAEQWVAACNVAGGGWRMPTRQQLATLHQAGIGVFNIDPVFHVTSWWVWVEPRDSSAAWCFAFDSGTEERRNDSRVFGVRSRPR